MKLTTKEVIKLTHQVPIRFKTKKAFKEAVKEGEQIFLIDPSVFHPRSGFIEEILEHTDVIYATNHPKRSWFAQIRRNKKTGKIIVK